MGQSGKMSIYATDVGESDPAKVMVEMDAIQEVDASGTELGTTGPLGQKHGINTFATQAFTFSPPEEVMVGSANATKVTFSTQVNQVGHLKVETFMMTSSGTVGPEDWPVTYGDVKWNIVLSNWTFCKATDSGTCKNKEGEFVDLVIAVKGQAAAPSSVDDDSYDLGGGKKLDLTPIVEIDGTETTMPDGYPKIVTRGGKQMFVFRFPKFTSSAVYDPLVSSPEEETVDPTLAPTPSPPSTGGPEWATSTVTPHLCLVLLALMYNVWLL